MRNFGTGAALEFPSTSHISIVDKYGNARAMTTTIEDMFGSRLITRSGFLLNNELTDLSFAPVDEGKPVANRVEAGKRPRSSMAPTIVYDGKGTLYMVAGSPGGSGIINYVAETLIGVLDWGLDPQAAIDLPNVGKPQRTDRAGAGYAGRSAGTEAQGARTRDTRHRAYERHAGDRTYPERLDRRCGSATRRHGGGRLSQPESPVRNGSERGRGRSVRRTA